ncbi:MAG: spore germination protein [Tumebacillaceae bacterium]
MRLIQKLMKKLHKRPSTDHVDQTPQAFPQGKLGSYEQNVQQIRDAFQDCNDVKHRELPTGMILSDSPAFVCYIESIINVKTVEAAMSTVHNLLQRPQQSMGADDTAGQLEVARMNTIDDAVEKVLEGWTVFFVKKSNTALAVNTYQPPSRSIDRSETESIIIGPQESFTEVSLINLSMLRRRVKSPAMKVRSLRAGKYTQTSIYVLYMEDIVQQEFVDTVFERIQQVNIDGIFDSGELVHLIDDNPFSPFPQFHMTERPERITSHLLEGKVAIMVDGSSFVLSGPASFIEFFQTSEDYTNRWFSASVIRTLRLVGVIISTTLSALYVAVVTYHYELIPTDMLVTLTQSRARVPFPPLYETLLMEVTIELLREAGARLPTKVGQTIGIVGGIVIGQAAVTAGLTSNILIISVALSTIASFITPSYIMSSALRALRFPLIMLAGFWGLYGLYIGFLMLAVHFVRLSSIGAPYLSPFAPLRLSDWKDTFLRAPLFFMKFRPSSTRPRETQRQPFRDMVTKRAVPTSLNTDSERGSEE